MLQFFKGFCSCGTGGISAFCAKLCLLAVSLALGSLIAWRPKKVIEIQAQIYVLFNWRLEPISMDKAVRNMRYLGLLAVLVSIVVFGIMIFVRI